MSGSVYRRRRRLTPRGSWRRSSRGRTSFTSFTANVDGHPRRWAPACKWRVLLSAAIKDGPTGGIGLVGGNPDTHDTGLAEVHSRRGQRHRRRGERHSRLSGSHGAWPVPPDLVPT